MFYISNTAIGLVSLTVLLLNGWVVGRREFNDARIGLRLHALVFLPLWLFLMITSFWRLYGRPGFVIKDLAPYFLIELAVPSTIALLIAWVLRSHKLTK
jgi:hypothetical protein